MWIYRAHPRIGPPTARSDSLPDDERALMYQTSHRGHLFHRSRVLFSRTRVRRTWSGVTSERPLYSRESARYDRGPISDS